VEGFHGRASKQRGAAQNGQHAGAVAGVASVVKPGERGTAERHRGTLDVGRRRPRKTSIGRSVPCRHGHGSVGHGEASLLLLQDGIQTFRPYVQR
jgi:hypothetical protein